MSSSKEGPDLAGARYANAAFGSLIRDWGFRHRKSRGGSIQPYRSSNSRRVIESALTYTSRYAAGTGGALLPLGRGLLFKTKASLRSSLIRACLIPTSHHNLDPSRSCGLDITIGSGH